MRRNMISTQTLVFLIILIMGISFCAVAIGVRASEAAKKQRCTESTIATVVDYEERTNRDSDGHYSYSYFPVLQYDVYGKTYINTANVGANPPMYAIGDDVTVYYNSTNPYDFYIHGNVLNLVFVTVFGVIGVAFLVIDVLFLIYKAKGLL